MSSVRDLLQIKTREVFVKTDAQGQRPQAQMYAWIAERTTQGARHVPLFGFAQERRSKEPGQTWRLHEAIDISTVLDEIARGQPKSIESGLFYMARHEIVVAPCKWFGDFEVCFDEAKDIAEALRVLELDSVDQIPACCDALFAALLEALLRRAGELTGRDDLSERDFVVMTAHKATKWSVHCTLDGSSLGRRDGEPRGSILFETATDCFAFVTQTAAALPSADKTMFLIDTAVYAMTAKQSSMRTYWSSKPLEPERRLMTTDERLAGAKQPTLATFLRALATCIAVPRAQIDDELAALVHGQPYPALPDHFLFSSHSAPAQALAQTTPVRCALDGMKRTTGKTFATPGALGIGVVSSPHITALLATAEFAERTPLAPIVKTTDTGEPLLIVPCRDTRCEAAPGGSHKRGHNCTYLVVDLLGNQWHQKCHSASCIAKREAGDAKRHAQPFTTSQRHHAQEFLKRDWPGGQSLVGDELADALCI